ncbi:MAG: cytochrome b/b6 domain-containing protein [Xanthomonadales bacterium]|nr:cytochrome b/b6 domain-containing protein [Xanthomonadales bacterium]
MNKQSWFIKVCVLSGLLLSIFSLSSAANGLHPEVPILDAQGHSVVESGLPMSTMTSCGGDCHETSYIMANSDHADAGASQTGKGGNAHEWQQGPGYFGGWDPLAYDTDGLNPGGDMDLEAWLKRYGSRHVGGGPVAGLVEMDCLLCHTDLDQSARTAALGSGDFAWANSAPLSSMEILVQADGQWQWDVSKFQANGALQKGLLDIRKPRDENCSLCHGIAENSLDRPLTIPVDQNARHNTSRTGQIISPQKLLNSGLNISNKEELNYPFDVHSDRVVGCVNCHYSLNNPVYFRQRAESRPAHLDFDPRRLGNADYLVRPLHQFAKGHSTLGLAAADTEYSLRRCESCHDAENVHEWLPYKQRHFTSLACESCHIPKLFGPGLQTVDWTMLDSEEQPLKQYRNVSGDPVAVDSLIEGFRPLILPRTNAEGDFRLAPFNLVTTWYWSAGDPGVPVSRDQLEAAIFVNGTYHPDLVAALDANGDGQLSGDELRLVDETRVSALRNRLQAIGLTGLQIQGEITPFSISHNVVNGQRATRDCSNCHDRDSVLATSFSLSDYQPGDVQPQTGSYAGVEFSGEVTTGPAGSVSFLFDHRSAGFYIIGLHAENWADLLGVLMFLGIVLGVSVHATARYISSRRRPAVHHEYERVHMYDAYERLWHWLQASAILLLLFTGLIIHKPHFFGMFSFPYVVNVHNVLGFILVTNAVLSLFYHLASGEIRQYLPAPKGFIANTLAQAMYYSQGIFAGKPHPLEKTKQNKLNPLQQVTYLAILNILLPAQIITGVLIWGLQRWPHIAAELGGLPMLALVHTLVAWTFATFIVMHIYLTTTGHKPIAGIQSMITGWDDVEKHTGDPASVSPQGESK